MSNRNDETIVPGRERTVFGMREEAAGAAWNSLTKDDKTDFIGGWLIENESHDDLVERAMELALVNDQVESWYDDGDQVGGRQWSKLSFDERADAVEGELADWDDEELIEKIVDDMDDDGIESFRAIYTNQESERHG